ncbi:MAG: tail fiber domain-containing protein [Bacteroidetes bacterium]|nr:tail fiber domain-containing protein [Bacteroidota bacterium]
MKKLFLKSLPVALAWIITLNVAEGQNVAITDDNGYTAHSSAMLDVKSTSKGMLVPRVTSTQRMAISSPATGLLVFDTNAGNFYFYNGLSWTNLSSGNASGLWGLNGSKVFLNDTTYRLGIGTKTPYGKMEVKADGSTGADDPIFGVVNFNGDTVFAVYPQGVRILVEDDATKVPGSKAGFAVGGFSLSKNLTNDYLVVTPDSVRIYIEDTMDASKSGANKGGFAVGGFSLSKGTPTNKYLTVSDATTQVYISDSTAGFGITNIESGSDNLMDLTTQNYFIGHQTGQQVTTGIYNQLIGYQSGLSLTSGKWNTFSGYQAGYHNTTGTLNVFIGYKSGYNNTTSSSNVYIGPHAGEAGGDYGGNVFIGNSSGRETHGSSNTFIGDGTGRQNTSGAGNILMGYSTGYGNLSGSYNTVLGTGAAYLAMGNNNVFLGYCAGRYATGAGNVFLGTNAGWYETGSNKLYIENSDISTPLIYGDFASDYVTINGCLTMADTYFRISNNPGTGTVPTSYCYQGSVGSSSKQYAFSIWDALWVTDRAWFDEYIDIDVSGAPALYVAGTEALWYDGTYFSWGYGGTFNYFADKVGIGTSAPYYKLELPNNSSVTAGCGRAYAWNTYSDARVKRNQEAMKYGLSELLRLQPKKYDHYTSEFSDGKLRLSKEYSRTIGLIAQEVYEVIPEAVERPADENTDLWSLDYEKLIPVLINGLKEQQQMIEDLKSDNEAKTKRIDELSTEIETIKVVMQSAAKK